MTRGKVSTVRRCNWCSKNRRHDEGWERQRLTTGEWRPVCDACHLKAWRNPWYGLLGQDRQTPTPDEAEVKP